MRESSPGNAPDYGHLPRRYHPTEETVPGRLPVRLAGHSGDSRFARDNPRWIALCLAANARERVSYGVPIGMLAVLSAAAHTAGVPVRPHSHANA